MPSPDTSRFTDEFFRGLHSAEFERKDKHDSLDTFLLAATTLLGGIAVYYSRILPAENIGLAGVFFHIFFWIFVVVFAAATISLAGSVWPRTLAYLTEPQELYNYVEGMRAHLGFDEKDEGKLQAAVESEMRRISRSLYVKCSSQNRLSNLRKQAWQTYAKILLVIEVFIVLANAVPAYIVQRDHVDYTNVRVIEVLQSGVPTPPNKDSNNEQQPPAGKASSAPVGGSGKHNDDSVGSSRDSNDSATKATGARTGISPGKPVPDHSPTTQPTKKVTP